MNQGIFDFALPKVTWTPPDLNALPRWSEAKRVGIDIETRDPDLKAMGPGCRRDPSKNYVVGIGIAIEDGPEMYLPFAHEGGDNLDKAKVISYVNDNLKDFSGVIAGANLGYEGDWLAQTGINILDKKHADVQVSDVLIYELHEDYDLDTICARWGLPGKDERVLKEASSVYRVHPKKELWKLPARYVAGYCMTDARRPLQILRRQQVEIEKQGLQQIWDLESKVTPILTKMRRRGVRVDLDKVDQIEKKCLEVEREMCAKVKHATGISITPDELMNAEALAKALRVAGFKPGTTIRGKASVDKDLLKDCGHIGEWLLEAREWHVLRGTYCKQIRDHAIYHGPNDYRVHTTTNQVRATDESDNSGGKKTGRGVRYGRTSCTDPSLQNQPIRSDKFGKLWRSVFIKKLGSAGWACSDWSQQEPRIGVHYAELLGLKGAKEFADEYRKNPNLDIHQFLTDLANDPVNYPRKIIKNFVNGRLYGMGDLKLCWQLRLPTEWKTINGVYKEVAGPECRAIVKKFREFAPWIDGLVRAAADVAKKNGHVWTYLRRKCNFPKRPGTDEVDYAHKAFNRVGQGSAADQMKATLVEADKCGIPVDLIVHDEFDFSYDDIKQAKELKELQLNTVKFNVPMKVDLEVGEDWGNVEKISA